MKAKIQSFPLFLIPCFVSLLLIVSNGFAQPIGAANGLFSISEGQQVYFSQGNLQYQASSNTWRFAENQWDFVGGTYQGEQYGTVTGSSNNNISSTYSGWIDLFGWGTSGWNSGSTCYRPWEYSSDWIDFHPGGINSPGLVGNYANADWGVYNAISNGGNQPGLWRTLTGDEWDYLLTQRSTLSGLRWAFAEVNGVNGLILLPDDWSTSFYNLIVYETYLSHYTDNIINSDTWTTVLSPHGAVFLPAAGWRSKRQFYPVDPGGIGGNYWSTTPWGNGASYFEFGGGNYPFCGVDSQDSSWGFSVRLVRQATNTGYSITTSVNPSNGGAVTGGGYYQQGQTCALTATPASGYTFTNWTENGNVVSTSANYTFTVSGNRSLVANFTSTLAVPSVVVDEIIRITPRGVTLRIRITDNGGSTVTSAGYLINGHQYGLSNPPESFVIGVSDLAPGTTYTAQPYAENSQGMGYGPSISFTTLPSDYTYTVATSSSPAEGGTVVGGGEYHYQETCTLTAIANEGYSFAYFVQEGVAYWNGNPISFNVNDGTSFVAYFNVNSYEIEASSSPSEGGSVSGGGTYTYGSSCTLTATPASGYTFTNWMENGNVVSTSANYTFTVSGNRSLVANFTSTLAVPSVVVDEIIRITPRGVTLRIRITDNGGSTVTSAGYLINGHQYGLSNPPESFVIGVSDLAPGTTYTAQPYAENSQGMGYGPSISFTTLPSDYTYTVATSSSPAEGGTVVGGGEYHYQETCTLTAIANEGYSFAYFVQEGVAYWNGNPISFNVNDGTSFVAYFNVNSYEIEASSSPSEGGTVSGGGTYTYGSTCTLTATANEGYAFVNWTENGDVVSTDPEYSFTVSGNRNLVANFAEEVPTCNIVFDLYDSYGDSWNGNYLVVSYGDITEQFTVESGSFASCSREIATGSVVSLSWIKGSYIGECSFDIKFENGVLIYHGSNLSATFQEDIAIDCELATAPYLISAIANPTEGGAVEGGGVYEGGSSCTLHAIPNPGYIFVYWTENGQQVSTDATYSFTVAGNRDLVAYFSAPLTITVSSNPSEGGTVTGAGVFDYGNTCTLTAIANPGYTFIKWTKNGEDVSYLSPFIFSVTENADYVAVFEETAGIAIGAPEGTNVYFPSYSYFKHILTQQIYTHDEIGGSTTVTGISFFNTGGQKTRNYDIYLVHTDKVAFSNNKDWIAVTESDRVFSGDVTMMSGCWTTIEFDTPFAYNGTSNLAVVVDDNSGDYTNSPHMECRVFNTQGKQAIRVYRDGANCNPYNPFVYGGALYSVKNQIVLSVTPASSVAQTITLSPGWNWFSTYLSGEPTELLQMLENSLGGNGIVIKSNAVSTDYYEDYGWYGDLDDEGLKSSQMYMVKTNAACTVELEGVPANPAEVGITIRHGWNWIGFPCAEAMSVAEALSGFQAEDGDILKSSGASTDYYEGFGWYGELETMEPGEGFMYYSNSQTTKTIYFP